MGLTAVRNPGGRPPKYESRDQIEKIIEDYFKKCEGEILRDNDEKPVLNKWGNPVVINQRPPTVTGLALALGFLSRQALLTYQGKKEFHDTITRAKSMIERYTEERLFDKDGVNGAKFSLVNNFRGWAEHPQSDLDREEQQARIDTMRAKAQIDNTDSIADDGFLSALSNTAAKDWSDETED